MQNIQNIDKKKINWAVVCVNEFAKNKELNTKTAFQYLYAFGGIQFIKDYYEAEHLLSFDDAIEDLTVVCQRNGGDI